MWGPARVSGDDRGVGGWGGGARKEWRGRGDEGRRATGGRRSAAASGPTTRRGRRRGARGDGRGGVVSRGPGANRRGRKRGGSRTASSSSNIRVRLLRAGASDFARSPPPPPRGKDASSASSSALSRFDPIAASADARTCDVRSRSLSRALARRRENTARRVVCPPRAAPPPTRRMRRRGAPRREARSIATTKKTSTRRALLRPHTENRPEEGPTRFGRGIGRWTPILESQTVEILSLPRLRAVLSGLASWTGREWPGDSDNSAENNC